MPYMLGLDKPHIGWEVILTDRAENGESDLALLVTDK